MKEEIEARKAEIEALKLRIMMLEARPVFPPAHYFPAPFAPPMTPQYWPVIPPITITY
jgi:hypothetical protein